MANEKQARRNHEITAANVRVIDEQGEQVGILSIGDALKLAETAGEDLVEVSPNADPPVCRIMDFGKFRFEMQKKHHAAKKKQKQIQLKEIKFRPGTDEGDYQVKLRNLIRFLEAGDKTKVTVRFRGRELAHMDLGERLMSRLETDLAPYGVVDQSAKREARQMVMVLSPKKK